MLSNRAAIWLFIIATIAVFGGLPMYNDWLIIIAPYYHNDIFGLLLLFWIITLGIVGWSYAITLYMADRNHWFTPVMIAIVYLLLTKEARVVAKDFYKFNFFKGDEK